MQHFFQNVTMPEKLGNFIGKTNGALLAEKLVIVNAPNCSLSFEEAQEAIGSQMDRLAKLGTICETTENLIHLGPIFNDLQSLDELRILSTKEVEKYYEESALIVMESKKCTCDGLCAIAFEIAKRLLKELAIEDITVDLCQLRNWSHTLIRVSQKMANEDEVSFFYDPWYQQCYTSTPNHPKIFAEKALEEEMRTLKNQTKMIQPTQTLNDTKNDWQLVENTSRDYAYFILCSTGAFKNPAPETPDPTRVPTSNWAFPCIII